MRYGTMGVDFEERVNFERLRKERLDKAKAALKASNLGSLVCYDFDNIRYITGTHIGEWCRNKMNRYCILPKDGEPLLFRSGDPCQEDLLPVDCGPGLPGRRIDAGRHSSRDRQCREGGKRCRQVAQGVRCREETGGNGYRRYPPGAGLWKRQGWRLWMGRR